MQMNSRMRQIADRAQAAGGREDGATPMGSQEANDGAGSDRTYYPEGRDPEVERIVQRASKSREAMQQAWMDVYSHHDECPPSRMEQDSLRRALTRMRDDGTRAHRPPPDTAASGLGSSLGDLYEKGTGAPRERDFSTRATGDGKILSVPYKT